MKYSMVGTVKRVEERVSKRWIRGVGKDAEFEESSDGWYLQLTEWPRASVYLGKTRPSIAPGDRLRITLEKCSSDRLKITLENERAAGF